MKKIAILFLLVLAGPALAEAPDYFEHTLAAGDSVVVDVPGGFEDIRFMSSTADVKLRLNSAYGGGGTDFPSTAVNGGIERYSLNESSTELWNEFVNVWCSRYILINTGAGSADVRVQSR